MSWARRPARTRLGRIVLAALVAGAQLGYGIPRHAEARVDPLRVIKRQIHKVNMLVVLDTSGSMTGVPGGDFTSATEAGIDCDNGVNCRGWGTPGGCPPDPPMCQPVLGTGCPDGTMPDMSDSGNFVKNPNFSTGGGSGPTWDAAANFTSGVSNAGDNNYPSETKCAVQKNGNTVKEDCSNSRKNSLPSEGCYVQQAPFGGDYCLNLAATTSYLLCNGDGSAYKAWEQTVSGLSASTNYVVWAHISHADHPQRTSSNQTTVASSTWQFKVDGSSVGTAATVPPEGDRPSADAWAKQDSWVRVQSSFKTGAAQTSATLALWDDATGADGDESAITQIHVRKCVPITGGLCAYTKEPCDASKPCAAISTCSLGEKPCSTPGAACEAVGHCQDTTDPPIFCTDELDCPQWGDKGKCAATGDSCNGPCASAKKCSVTGETCETSTPCPQNKTKGYCAANPAKSCSSDKQCKDSICIFPANSCGGEDNFCKHPHRPCHKPDESTWGPNTCIQRNNNCEIPPPAKPVCEQPDENNKIKMCQGALTVCTRDSECPKDDVCGPPTSRAVIAKRSLKKVIEETAGAVNYGFMTFWQDGYFPYFAGAKISGNGITTTKYYSRDELIASGCYDTVVLQSTCVLGKLRAEGGARYYVPYADRPTDQDFCGDVCAVKPGYRSGSFQGAYYETTSTTYNGGNGGRYESPTYNGREWNNLVYYTPNPRYYNGGETPVQSGFQFVDCQTTKQCGLKCGASFDPDLVNFLDVTGAKAQENAGLILKRLELAREGGTVVYEATPSGCALENPAAANATAPERHSAYHYMKRVQEELQSKVGMSDEEAQSCRANYVLFITDGAANGPGDLKPASGPFQAAQSACLDAACNADDPEAAGCECAAVLSAWHMRQKLKVKTLVVGFGGDVTQGSGYIINNRIAKAGGTETAFTATRESELVDALRAAIYRAAEGSYATSQASSSSGTQQASGIQLGKYVLDTRVDFPSWKGHLIAYDVSGETPEIVWDAATELDKADWATRRVYVGSSTGPKPVTVEANAVTNAATMATLFNESLGITNASDPKAVTAVEADQILRWLMGDPLMRNSVRLGAIINSTPIDVGGVGLYKPLDGAEAFYEKYKDRVSLTYVGTSYGMLHAFFTKDTTLGDGVHVGGSEAYAFLPQEMLPRIRRLFAQGGQIADPEKHVFGLANSAKVKNVCVKGCTKDDSIDAEWKTLLVMPEGFEGKLIAGEPHSNKLFVLDITDPVVGGAIAGPKMWWSTTSVDKDKYNPSLGETISLPAFAFNKTDSLDDNWLMMTSGYRVNVDKPEQGRRIVISQLNDNSAAGKGTLRYEAKIPSEGDCSQELTNLTDVATARDHGSTNGLRLLGGYFGDTWGGLWRWPGDAKDSVDQVLKLGCDQPLHFSPAVVQLDRDTGTERKGEIWLVQVTNSALDEATENSKVRSQMVIVKEKADATGDITGVPSYNSGSGTITLSTADICKAYDGAGTCIEPLPENARPAGTPTVIHIENAAGFKIVSLWYEPAKFGCGQGNTYLAVHDVLEDANIKQIAARELAKEAVIGTVVAGGSIWVATREGLINIVDVAPISLKPIPPKTSARAFRRSAWMEIF